MNVTKINLADTKQFNSFFTDYIAQKPALAPFYSQYPSIENFEKQIAVKGFGKEKRENLHKVLSGQYKHISPFPAKILDLLLEENTYTVTTGHQLNIFGGPLYLIYKLITTVNLAKALKQKYPAYNFVPVYWMATEDHDFEEISYFYLFGKKYTWETSQTGAVGRMNPEAIKAILEELPEKTALFEKAYLEHKTLADATRYWVHKLFGEQDLLCMDADHADLKASFRDIIRQDIFQQTTHQKVSHMSDQLTQAGYETQVNPRQINFFYLYKGLRERMVGTEKGFEVLNTDMHFTKQELEELIETNPERFSPNVLLRPVYQEVILPNLAYIGGPAEVIYWLQLKELFNTLQMPFPLLMPRNFALIIGKTYQKKLEKLGIKPEELFEEETLLKRLYVEKNVTDPVAVEEEGQMISKAFDLLVEKALQLDKTLEGFVRAEAQKSMKSLENIEKRLKKAEEKNQETGINQLLNVKSRLFPNGSLQERTDNFLNFCLNDPAFITKLSDVFDPFDFRFQVLTEDE
jgi:bacillithiol biosynthesis cysteine-adding enzyme BshC